MIYYCDSSALVKIYLEENGSRFMRNLRSHAAIGNILVNVIAGPEVLSALHRRTRTGDLTAEILAEARKNFGRDYLEFFSRHPVSDAIIQLAMQLIEKYPLRGYDSVQLATALNFQNALRMSNGREVVFLSSDKVLNNAARSEGLAVINPSEQETSHE
jgi:predicted nucleic acid-binding protein